METWPNKCREGGRRGGPGGARDETRERKDGRGAREGEREGDLRSMAQEFMIRKGDESVIYGPLSTVFLPSPQ